MTDLYPLLDISKDKKEKNVFTFEGPFFIELLSVFGNYVKFITKNNPSARTKLFKIFIELSQNVSNYSEDTHKVEEDYKIGKGKLILSELEKHYQFTTINVVKIGDAKILADRCETINASTKPKLRQLKREMRINSPGEKFGARIGLIQAVLLSNNLLDYEVQELEDGFSLFRLTIKVDK